MHSDFLNKLTRKIHAEQCLALYSRWWTQQTYAGFQLGLWTVQTSEPTSKTRGNTLLVLLLCNILYCVSYRDNCIRIHTLYRRKMYRCRPITSKEYFSVQCPSFEGSTLINVRYLLIEQHFTKSTSLSPHTSLGSNPGPQWWETNDDHYNVHWLP